MTGGVSPPLAMVPDGNAAAAQYFPLAVVNDQGCISFDPNYCLVTRRQEMHRLDERRWDFVKMRHDHCSWDQFERRLQAGKTQQARPHDHGTRAAAGEHTASLVHAQDGLPDRRVLQCPVQVIGPAPG